MAEKILVADDSLTIQKVISITLSNTDYELVECLSEQDLMAKLEADKFDLILLDFNLSEKLSGYELSKSIKTVSPDTAILAMLGTFDTIDDYQLGDCGIGDKIVKPFESEKFIQKCRMLLDNNGELAEINLDDEDDSFSLSDEENHDSDDSDIIGNDWIVDSPKPTDRSSATLSKHDQEPEELVFDEADAEDALSEEMKGWGIEVPNVIGAEDRFGIFPPKIVSENTESDVLYLDEEDSRDTNDLLFEEESSEEDLDATDPSFQMPQSFTNDDASNSLEEEIDKEDFWAVDASEVNLDYDSNDESLEEGKNSFDQELSLNRNDLDDIKEDEVDHIFSDLETEVDSEKESYKIENMNNSNGRSPAIEVDIDTDEIVAQVKEAMTPMLEELVKKFCREKIEQVAWEVIPDLAENLIKKEIKEITDTLEH